MTLFIPRTSLIILAIRQKRETRSFVYSSRGKRSGWTVRTSAHQHQHMYRTRMLNAVVEVFQSKICRRNALSFSVLTLKIWGAGMPERRRRRPKKHLQDRKHGYPKNITGHHDHRQCHRRTTRHLVTKITRGDLVPLRITHPTSSKRFEFHFRPPVGDPTQYIVRHVIPISCHEVRRLDATYRAHFLVCSGGVPKGGDGQQNRV